MSEAEKIWVSPKARKKAKEQKRREYEENTPEEERFARELNSQRKS